MRLGEWISGRRGPEMGEVLLDRRRVYILPTPAGVLFGAAMLMLLIGSINYSLQLGYVLTFLVTGMAVVGMHTTHSNLANIVLRGVRVEPVYAGDVVIFQLTATNPTTLDRFALRFSFIDAPEPRNWLGRFRCGVRRRPRTATRTVSPPRFRRAATARIGVPLPAPRPRQLPAPRIVIETRFPFGLWRAWAYLTPALTAIVYPRPESDAPPLPATGLAGGEGVGLASTGDDFAGVRPYSPGDPQKMIAWRLAARCDELSVKQFDAQGGGDLLLDFDAICPQLDVEQKLSRLTRWVLDADAAHMRYGLRIPGYSPSPAPARSIVSTAWVRSRCTTREPQPAAMNTAAPADAAAAAAGPLRALLGPIARVFGPQTSSAARERRDMLVLLVAVALVVFPHFEHTAWWATASSLLLLTWRVWITLAQRPLPGRVVMLPLLLAAAGAVYLQHRTLAGQDAGVTLLLLLMALKLLEMRARRDIFVVIFLAFFILLTQFLYGQDLPVAAITVAAVVALFFVLVSVNLDDVDLPAMRKLRLVGITLLRPCRWQRRSSSFSRASPVRCGACQVSRASGKTGLSNSMSPGSISQLLESDAIVFRVRFDNAVPANDKLYWRGPVFGSFNGRSWTAAEPATRRSVCTEYRGEPRTAVSYEVTLEPHKRDWLFALDVPAALPQLETFRPRLTPEMQLLVPGLITERIRYDMRSYTGYRLGARTSELELQDWLELPKGFNPRAIQFAAELRSRVVPAAAAQRQSHDSQLVNAVLDHFRRGEFNYTCRRRRSDAHSVDEFMFDTRLGFCEHYASAFVFLMRALDVPARVVTGYQGGELNPVDGFMTVRQSDAHAWTEVWLARSRLGACRSDRGRGAIAHSSAAPSNSHARRAGALEGRGADYSWLRSLRFNWEAVQNGWNQWVLSRIRRRASGRSSNGSASHRASTMSRSCWRS